MKYVVVLLVLVGLIVGTSLADGPEAKPPQKKGEPTKKDEEPKSASTQTVIAEGVGTSADEALKDAFRSAVRQVVGAVVDAETLVKNDEVISDKVLTFSNGFVKKYEEVSKKEDKGLVRIKIKADVERKGVIEKLKAANVKVKEVDGKGLFAEAVTDLDREKDAAALLKKTLEGFPLNCMSVSVVGEPKLVEKNEEKATVSVTVQVEPNREAYKTFVKKLKPVLEKMADKDGTGSFLLKTSDDDKDKRGFLHARDHSPVSKLYPEWYSKTYNREDSSVKDKIVIALCTQWNQKVEQIEFSYFVVDSSLRQLLVHSAFESYQTHLTLEDSTGEVVTSDRFEPFERHPYQSPYIFDVRLVKCNHWYNGDNDRLSTLMPNFNNSRETAEKKAVIFFISPTFVLDARFFEHKPQLRIERKLTLTLDELKKVQKAKIELQVK